MAKLVITGASITCTFGAAPATFSSSTIKVKCMNQPAGTIQDFAPMMNIPTFGMCLSLANPMVASATSAAQGVLTPQACIPVTTSPWSPGCATVLIENKPALNDVSTCMCTWAGSISVSNPGQVCCDVPDA